MGVEDTAWAVMLFLGGRSALCRGCVQYGHLVRVRDASISWAQLRRKFEAQALAHGRESSPQIVDVSGSIRSIMMAPIDFHESSV